VRLLAKAADPAESMRRQLERSPSLADALSRVRELLSGKTIQEDLAHVGVEVLASLAEDDNEPLAPRLAAWMLIREQTGGRTPEPLQQLALESLEADDENGVPALWHLFGQFTAMRDQERCLSLLKEVLGPEQWLDEGARQLKHAPTGMVRPLIEALLADDRKDVLTDHYKGLLARPMRNPQAFVALAELAENGHIEEGGSTPAQRLHAMLQLAAYLKSEAGASSPLARTHKRLVSLLTSGEPPLVSALCRECDMHALRTAHLIVERGVDVTLDRAFTHVIADIAPGIFKASERPFWETETLWTTRAGLARRQAELRELIEVKIPDNAEAIGRAASYGDLSENSEWEAALEEQRNLTTRASEIEAEVAKAGLIENTTIPEGVVAPGTLVRFVEAESGDERTMRILGPWDTIEDGIISYRSPLAMGLLGKRKGQTANLKVPSGDLEVDILEVQALELPV
jgi:transcription elongation factor GreA